MSDHATITLSMAVLISFVYRSFIIITIVPSLKIYVGNLHALLIVLA